MLFNASIMCMMFLKCFCKIRLTLSTQTTCLLRLSQWVDGRSSDSRLAAEQTIRSAGLGLFHGASDFSPHGLIPRF